MLLLKTVPCSSTTLLFRTFIWFSLKSKTKSLCVFFKHVESTVLKSESFWLHFCDWCLLETLAVNPDYRCKCGTLDKEETWQGAFCSCLGSAEKLWVNPYLGALCLLWGENISIWGKIDQVNGGWAGRSGRRRDIPPSEGWCTVAEVERKQVRGGTGTGGAGMRCLVASGAPSPLPGGVGLDTPPESPVFHGCLCISTV